MNKFTAVSIAIIVLCFGGLILWATGGRRGKMDVSDYDPNAIVEASPINGNIGDHVRGKADSNVLVVEYADMSCPGCASMMPYMSKIYEEYGDKVAFVFRHFPIQSHQNSRSAAAAIESAARQDYYWEMLEALYENRSDWLYASGQERTDIYAKVFKEVAPDGDEDKFRLDMNSSEIDKKISFDYNLGKDRSNVNATPSIFVNGKMVDVSGDGKSFDDVADDIMKMIKEQLGEDTTEDAAGEAEEKTAE